MKAGIHPTWYRQAAVTCACGATYTVGSTMPQFHVEVCGACHPFYTGEAKYIDTQGRVERFEARKALRKEDLKKKKQDSSGTDATRKTLKEILSEFKNQGAE